MRILLLTALAILSAQGCSAYRKPLCHEANRVDIPNFEGKFSLAILDSTEFKIMRQKFTISRLEKGIYAAEGGRDDESIFMACEIEGIPFLETIARGATFPTTSFGSYRMHRNGDGSFDLSFLSVDTDVLRARGIPFQILESNDEVFQTSDKIKYQVVKVLWVDNSALSSEEFAQLLDVISIKVTLAPEPPIP